MGETAGRRVYSDSGEGERRAGLRQALESLRVNRYFEAPRSRPDRATIRDERIEAAIRAPTKQEVQTGGRIRRQARIDKAEGS
jgi:hypothetical protein